jgi:hypothetical protein
MLTLLAKLHEMNSFHPVTITRNAMKEIFLKEMNLSYRLL